jgi:hypothetical protein
MGVHENSIEAYKELTIAGRIAGLEEKAWIWIWQNPGYTTAEMEDYLGITGRNGRLQPSVTALKQKGCLRVIGRRECSITGKTADTYEALDVVPKDISVKKVTRPTKEEWWKIVEELYEIDLTNRPWLWRLRRWAEQHYDAPKPEPKARPRFRFPIRRRR